MDFHQSMRKSRQKTYQSRLSLGWQKNSSSACSNSRRAEGEVARRDLVAEAAARVADAEGDLHARGIDDVLEVEEDALRGLGAEIGLVGLIADRARDGVEHQVEHPRLGERAGLLGVGADDAIPRAGQRGERDALDRAEGLLGLFLLLGFAGLITHVGEDGLVAGVADSGT